MNVMKNSSVTNEPREIYCTGQRAVDESRAATYRLLARLWSSEVDSELWHTLSETTFDSPSGDVALDDALRSLGEFVTARACDSSPSSHGGLSPDDPSYSSPAFLRDTRPSVLRELSVDYAILCRGVDRSRGADPYESVHRNALGLMMQDEWESVLELYRAAGIALPIDSVEPEDHLGCELDAMALLCEKSAQPSGNHDFRRKALEIQSTLLNDHLRQWVPSFVRKVEAYAATEFYQGAARLTERYLDMDASYLSEALGDTLTLTAHNRR